MTLPRGWLTSGPLEDFWGDGGTYGHVPSEALPPVAPVGAYQWLVPLAPDIQSAVGQITGKALVRAGECVHAAKRILPRSFLTLMRSENLRARIPTSTACRFDLGTKLVPCPSGEGQLLRFLNDQQSCFHWHLRFAEGPPGVIVTAPTWRAGDFATLDEAMTPEKPLLVADSFDEFIRRFWLENTIWFALSRELPLDEEATRYLDHVRAYRTALH